ncbi:lipopolysaccharide biosynthesis protein [uncultured Roseibium sp.]|uniref:lipopolysaccharide biosynthesis protein n=1 Tax=uncultured Roseibium sp. TaxID=1936171 RepID=UPI0026167550|nr:lipopolysaccharide biosynthesis protein [uncultured Roseibium sp.]
MSPIFDEQGLGPKIKSGADSDDCYFDCEECSLMASMLRNSVVNTTAGILSMFMGFICSIIVARTLGVEGTGIVAYALWFMTVATIVSDYGMPQATLRFIARDVSSDQPYSALLQTLLSRFVVTTAIMAVGIGAYSLWLAGTNDAHGSLVWLATIVLFLSYAYSTISICAAQGLGQFDRVARMTLTGCVLQFFSVLGGAWLFGPVGAILGHATRHLPQALDFRNYLGQTAERVREIPADVKLYARNNWISGSVFALFGARIELALIGFFFSIVQVGYYSIGLTMSGMIAQLAVFILAFVVPQFGAMHDNADDAAFAGAFEETIRWLGIVVAPIAIGGASVANELIPAVFGEDFAPAVWPAVILLAFAIAQALASVISRAILAKNRSSDELRMMLVWCGVTTVSLLITVPSYGQLGAAWVRGVASILLLLMLSIYCYRVLQLRLPVLSLMKSTLAAAICGATAMFILTIISGLIGLLIAVSAAAPVYFLSLFLLKAVTWSEIRPLIDGLKTRVGPSKG